MRFSGGRGIGRVAPGICALWLTTLIGCSFQRPADPAMMDDLAELQIRIRLLQSDLTALRTAVAEDAKQQDQQVATEAALQARLDELGLRIDALPEHLAEFCPEPPEAATVTTQCESSPEAQRVVVSGDKLVVGEVERVWLDPPAAFLEAGISAASELSVLAAAELVEFERDGNRWVRFQITPDDETLTVERPVKRMARPAGGNGPRRPVVDLRVQLGDVREVVETALVDELPGPQLLILGRNFLTDVALLDVARKHVQPAFQAPD